MKSKRNISFSSFFNPTSLRFQLLCRSLLILAVLLAFIGVFQYIFMREFIYRNKAATLQTQIISLPRQIWEQAVLDSQEYVKRRLPYFFILGTKLAFIDIRGNFAVLAKEPGAPDPPQLEVEEYLNILNQDPGLHYKVIGGAGGDEQLLILQPIPGAPGEMLGVVQASTSTGPLKELLMRQLLIFLLLAFTALFCGLLTFFPVLNRTLVPLTNMVTTVEQIDAGNLARRFPTRQGQMEIDRLAESFNAMLDRLEASFKAERETQEQMRRFVADASHELRTPLTSIHGFLEVLLRGAANQPDQLERALKSMYSESARLNKLVRDLLLLAKLDRASHMELQEGLLDTVVWDMEPQLRILGAGRKLDIDIEPNMKCKFDKDKMKQLILNLFHNAVQHTDPENGYIKIALYGQRGGVQLSVQDNGPGISDIHLPHIFDRFYRAEVSRTRKYGGAGLGLAIAKAIVDAHGGTISVKSKQGEGCTFYVWLPA
ncbi:sensor histidine kinase [Moorella sulfitireducens]|uniref:sensor histidine kinase n=1 Tax=Neomoorella sulfitireducens TaxID=2972948 RepID=UPI0021AC97E6|nr:HAMP domain-containing sensor histidine kinase [Moorella sulfitireducens]